MTRLVKFVYTEVKNALCFCGLARNKITELNFNHVQFYLFVIFNGKYSKWEFEVWIVEDVIQYTD